MPKCHNCLSDFPNRLEIDGKIRFLNRRKYCLNCSAFGSQNNRKLHQLNDSTQKLCPKCEIIKPIAEFYARRNKTGNCSYCKTCSIKQITDRQRKLKQEAVAYKGGKCKCCGYSKCVAALEFHHRDRSKKDFAISQSRNLELEKIKTELDKCELVCSNCHKEIHAGLVIIS